jgi:hypothetical protein
MADSNADTDGDWQREDAPGDRALLTIEALSDRYDQSDERWLDQVVDLVDRLREDVGAVERRREPAVGQKGGVDALILALGSAGAFQAAVAVFRAWLGRDRTRRLRLVVTDTERRRHTVEITGDTIDSRTFHDVAEVMARRLPMT